MAVSNNFGALKVYCAQFSVSRYSYVHEDVALFCARVCTGTVLILLRAQAKSMVLLLSKYT